MTPTSKRIMELAEKSIAKSQFTSIIHSLIQDREQLIEALEKIENSFFETAEWPEDAHIESINCAKEAIQASEKRMGSLT